MKTEEACVPANDNCVTIHRTLRSANIARQQEWDAGNQLSLAYRGNELAGEVGEACNVIKKLERERLGIMGSRDTLEHLAEELADVIICADLIAMDAGVDPDRSEHPVNATYFEHKLLLSNYMASACGAVCQSTSQPIHSTRKLRAQLGVLISTAYAVAASYGVDLSPAVRAKFNTTSEKIGLRTRLVAA